jgi:hypothetical protein
MSQEQDRQQETLPVDSEPQTERVHKGAAGKALLVYLGTGSVGAALIAYLVFHSMGC